MQNIQNVKKILDQVLKNISYIRSEHKRSSRKFKENIKEKSRRKNLETFASI